MDKLGFVLNIAVSIFMLMAIWNNNYIEGIFWVLMLILNRMYIYE